MQKRGFSLMEMMVVMLIVAIIAAATAPMINKKMIQNASGDSPWIWTSALGNSIAFNINGNANSPAVIGAVTPPSETSTMFHIKSPDNTTPQMTVTDGNNKTLRFGCLNDSVFLSTEVDDSPGCVTIGYNASSKAGYAVVMGGGANTIGDSDYSVVIGEGANAEGSSYSVAIGGGEKNPGENHLEPIPAAVNGFGAVAVGTSSSAGKYSTTIGYDATTGYTDDSGNPENSTAIGAFSNTVDNFATALGSYASGQGLGAVAIGGMSFAQAPYSISIGGSEDPGEITTATAIGSIAIGGVLSSEEGETIRTTPTIASGNYSIALGAGTQIEEGSYSIAIGTNTAITKEVSNSIAVGYNTKVTGVRSVAIGSDAKVERSVTDTSTDAIDSGIAIGYTAKANSSGAIALGRNTTAEGLRSVAIGSIYNNQETKALGVDSVAIGTSAQATHDNSTAIGYNAKTSATNQIVLGDPETVVYIPGRLVVANDLAAYNGVFKNKMHAALAMTENNTGEPARDCTYDLTGHKSYKSEYPVWSYYQQWVDGLTSDRRLKDVGEVFRAGLEEVKKLEVFNFTYKKDPNKTPRVGVMAQDLEKIFPKAVFKGDDGFLRIRMEDMFYAVVNAVKELDVKLTALVEDVKTNIVDIADLKIKTLQQEKTIIELEETVKKISTQNDKQEKLIRDLEKRLAKLEKKNSKKEVLEQEKVVIEE